MRAVRNVSTNPGLSANATRKNYIQENMKKMVSTPNNKNHGSEE